MSVKISWIQTLSEGHFKRKWMTVSLMLTTWMTIGLMLAIRMIVRLMLTVYVFYSLNRIRLFFFLFEILTDKQTTDNFNKFEILKDINCLQEGAGLGRAGQGMSTALKVERLGKNAGVIVNEHEQNARGEIIFEIRSSKKKFFFVSIS